MKKTSRKSKTETRGKVYEAEEREKEKNEDVERRGDAEVRGGETKSTTED